MDADAVNVNPEIVTLPDRRILYATASTVDYDTFRDVCGAAIGALFAELGAKGIVWIPGTFGIETPYGFDDTAGNAPEYAKAFVIVDLTQDLPDLDAVQEGVLPGGRELVGTHTGSYEGLIASWGMLDRHRNEIGERVRNGVIYDLYVDDSQTTPEADLRTEMHFPLE